MSHERGTPHHQARAGSIGPVIRTAILHGMSHTDINGNIEHWLKTCRNEAGEYPTPAEFIARFEAEQIKHLDSQVPQPCGPVEDE